MRLSVQYVKPVSNNFLIFFPFKPGVDPVMSHANPPPPRTTVGTCLPGNQHFLSPHGIECLILQNMKRIHQKDDGRTFNLSEGLYLKRVFQND